MNKAVIADVANSGSCPTVVVAAIHLLTQQLHK